MMLIFKNMRFLLIIVITIFYSSFSFSNDNEIRKIEVNGTQRIDIETAIIELTCFQLILPLNIHPAVNSNIIKSKSGFFCKSAKLRYMANRVKTRKMIFHNRIDDNLDLKNATITRKGIICTMKNL